MTRYNPKYLLPTARNVGATGASFGTKGNSEVSIWKPDNRMPDTTRNWTLRQLHSGISDIGWYATNGSNLFAFASAGQSNNPKYITSPSYGSQSDSWTLRSAPFTDGSITGFTYLNGVWYMSSFANGSQPNAYLYTSSDAVSWTLRRTMSYGGVYCIEGWYNPGLSRWEASAMTTGMGSPSMIASIDGGANWTSTSGGWSNGTSPSFCKRIGLTQWMFGTIAGGLWYAYFTPGSAITSAAASPLGSVALTSFAAINIAPGATYYYLSTNTNVLALQINSYTGSWTVINSPAASGDYIVDMTTKSGGVIGAALLVVSTLQGKIYAGSVTSGNFIWQDISPAPLNSQNAAGALPVYKFVRSTGDWEVGTTAFAPTFPSAAQDLDTPASRSMLIPKIY